MDKTLTIEGIFKLAAGKGLKPRPWNWKRLQPYNGFPHEERVLKWQALHLAIQLDLISPAKMFPCEICGTTSPKAMITYHSEDYSSMEQHPVCRKCHTLIHNRNIHQQAWRDILLRYGDETKWFELLR